MNLQSTILDLAILSRVSLTLCLKNWFTSISIHVPCLV